MAGGQSVLWQDAYQDLIPRLSVHAAHAAPVLLGFSAFVDAIVPLHEAEALFAPDAPAKARALSQALGQRVERGIGGEIQIDWADGDAWLAEALPHRLRAGGTSLQIANILALMGVPALLALRDRSPDQLGLVHPDVRLAGDRGWATCSDTPENAARGKARHWIFETRLGTTVDGMAVRRPTRVILRLQGDGPERDEAFEAQASTFARTAGAAVLSSLVATPDEAIAETLDFVARQTRGWRDAGLPFLHLELADYGPRGGLREQLLKTLRGCVTSVGMSQSEWRSVCDADESVVDLRAFAEAHAIDRLCIHADEWAICLTRGDPVREREALMTGCLLAAARASAGEPVRPTEVPLDASFCDLELVTEAGEDWHLVHVPSPHLAEPRATIGLGDTFVAGCLLVHATSGISDPQSRPGETA